MFWLSVPWAGIVSKGNSHQPPYKLMSKDLSKYIHLEHLPARFEIHDLQNMKQDQIILFFEHISARQQAYSSLDIFWFKMAKVGRKGNKTFNEQPNRNDGDESEFTDDNDQPIALTNYNANADHCEFPSSTIYSHSSLQSWILNPSEWQSESWVLPWKSSWSKCCADANCGLKHNHWWSHWPCTVRRWWSCIANACAQTTVNPREIPVSIPNLI